MFALHKNYFYISILLLSSLPLISEEDPYIFIDSNAQKMVQVLIENIPETYWEIIQELIKRIGI